MNIYQIFSGGSDSKASPYISGNLGLILVWKWQPTPVFLPGKPCHRSLVGYRPWGQKVLDVTELEHGQHIFGRPYQVVLVNAEFRLNH